VIDVNEIMFFLYIYIFLYIYEGVSCVKVGL